jgi:tetratricopeptide (TPR) repeat protein
MMRACWVLPAAAIAMSAEAACQLTTYELPVRMVAHRPIASVKLNGTEVSMLVDSGAYFSMLTYATASQLQLPVNPLPANYRVTGHTGEIDAKLTRVKQASFGGMDWSDTEFLVGGNELGAGIQGVLGRNVLATGDTEYDLAHGVVRLVVPRGDCGDGKPAHWPADAAVAETPLIGGDKHAPLIVMRLNGTDVLALMDTGAVTTTVRLSAARRAGIQESDLKPIGRIGGAGVGRVQSWTTDFQSLALGSEKIPNARLGVDDGETNVPEMLLGLDYFLSHRVYMAKWQRKVYAIYNGGPIFWSEEGSSSSSLAPVSGMPPGDADGWARRGAAALARGDQKRAITDLDRACELSPQSGRYRMERARVHWAAKRWDDALADLDAALDLEPSLHAARVLRASLRGFRGDVPQALADLQMLDAALPASAHDRETMARMYDTYGLPKESLRQSTLWLDTHPNDAHADDVYNQRCWVRTTGNFELPQALTDCEKAVALDPKRHEHQDSLGWVRLRMGDTQAAAKAFDAALALKPDQHWSIYGRALAWRQQGQTDAAARDLAEARRLRPDIDDRVRKAGLPTAEPAAEGSGAH